MLRDTHERLGEQILEVIKSRRAIRQYLPKPVETEKIQQVLEAAIWSPSAHNRQPWRFVVIESDDARERLARMMGERLRADLERDGLPADLIAAEVRRSASRIVNAPVLILVALTMSDMDVYPDDERNQSEVLMAVQSVAMAGQTLMLAAHALGLATCWMCAPIFCSQIVTESLELPADWLPQGLITMGYAAQTRSKTREPLSTRVIWR